MDLTQREMNDNDPFEQQLSENIEVLIIKKDCIKV
jgi:hypothetical protein